MSHNRQTREEVYKIIDSERDYQDNKWTDIPKNSVGDWLVYMRYYLTQAEERHATFDPNYTYSENALDSIRKLTALGVACLEENPAKSR